MAPVQRKVWIILTAALTLIAGLYAARGDTLLFWAILALWLFLSFLLAACKPGEKPRRRRGEGWQVT
jgi:hypothetical protein